MVKKSVRRGCRRIVEQAARLDGLRVWRMLLRITLPLAKPMLGRRRCSAGCWPGTSFFYAAVYQLNAAQTLPVTIAGFTAGRATDDGLVAAVGILSLRRCLSPSGCKTLVSGHSRWK